LDVQNKIADTNKHGNSPANTLRDWIEKVEKVEVEADDIFIKYNQRTIHLVSSDYKISRSADKKLHIFIYMIVKEFQLFLKLSLCIHVVVLT